MKNFLNAISLFTGIAAILFATSSGFSQAFVPPDGEAIKGTTSYSHYHTTRTVTWSQSAVYTYVESNGKFIGEGIYYAPSERSISDVIIRDKGSGPETIVTLDDGSVIELTSSTTIHWGKLNLAAGETPDKLIGDALYMLTNQNIYVSRDTAKTWAIDTAGLNGTPIDIAIDTFQFVYAINNNGELFNQDPNQNTWKKITSLPKGASARKIFIDRKNRIYLAASDLLYHSSNGLNWILDTAGIGFRAISSFGDDAFGNVYLITSPYDRQAIYRSSGSGWTQIDAQLHALNADSLITSGIYTGIGGDTVLIATTYYGVFSSIDQGVTWTESNDGIKAEHVYGLVKTPADHFVASTNLGIFERKETDTVWQKTFPSNGFAKGARLFQDNAGNIYTRGPLAGAGILSAPSITEKSTDGGLTWFPDTLGLSSIYAPESNATFFVDETGTQHYAVAHSPILLFSKQPGKSWMGDSSGFSSGAGFNVPQAFGSDDKGTLWLSITSSPRLWSRPISGGAWSTDTSGLSTEILNSFAAGKNGTLYAGGYAGVWKRSANKWTFLLSPKGIPLGTPAYSVSVDSSGALIAGYQHFGANFNSIGDGVFATTDDGANWTNLRHVDTTTFFQFISYGDTTYGLSYYNSVFVFTTGATGAVKEQNVISAALDIYPNPASGSVTIEIGSARTSLVEIFDVLGNLVKSFSGNSNAFWNGHNSSGAESPGGIYIIRASGVDNEGKIFSASKQIILQK